MAVTLEEIQQALDLENFDGYSVAADGTVSLSTETVILDLKPDGTWAAQDFGIAEAVEADEERRRKT